MAIDTGVLQDSYNYDQNGNVVAIADWINEGPGGTDASRTMGYDGLDRLSVANSPGVWGSASYGYDTLDNLRTSTISGRVSTYNYGARNLLDSLQSTAGGFSYNYTYDNRGNLITRGGQTFGFDLGNRLTTATNLDTYVYDGFGRRVKTTAVDGTVTVSIYSPAGQLLYTRRTGGPNPPQSTQYIYLHSHQIAEVKK
jgi:YD repeat-containing protein